LLLHQSRTPTLGSIVHMRSRFASRWSAASPLCVRRSAPHRSWPSTGFPSHGIGRSADVGEVFKLRPKLLMCRCLPGNQRAGEQESVPSDRRSTYDPFASSRAASRSQLRRPWRTCRGSVHRCVSARRAPRSPASAVPRNGSRVSGASSRAMVKAMRACSVVFIMGGSFSACGWASEGSWHRANSSAPPSLTTPNAMSK